ncbi:DinB family protein [Bacillus sp. ISL-46]|uniref:DinB family protein n=1 Tax=Bacillus sp. ISL-46 TaxID=2819129 RepID=UPI001BEA92D0|nr:DinB family protein [Bacillus sp. ISL-46]MBT2723959.1 hypothetical protein [Bacillus sp. ISL-46]
MDQNEYEWVRHTRGTLLEFCRKLEPNDFTRHNGYGWQSVRDSLVHVADCYNAWLGSFILLKTKKPLTPKEELLRFNLDEIKVSLIN